MKKALGLQPTGRMQECMTKGLLKCEILKYFFLDHLDKDKWIWIWIIKEGCFVRRRNKEAMMSELHLDDVDKMLNFVNLNITKDFKSCPDWFNLKIFPMK